MTFGHDFPTLLSFFGSRNLLKRVLPTQADSRTYIFLFLSQPEQFEVSATTP